jgi:NitT/TauT family transport system permease protein
MTPALNLRSVASSVRGWYAVPLALLLWEALALSGLVSPRVLPTLGRVGTAFAQDTLSGDLPFHAWVTAYRTLAGFAIGSVAGVLIGFALARLRWVEYLFEPIFFAGYPIPKIALFPIFMFLFGIGTPSKIAFAALECLYPVVVSTHLASRAIGREIVWAGENMGMNRSQLLRHVLVPAALPGIMNGLRIAMPIGITVVVVTEMIADTRGLGYYIAFAGASFRYDRLYAGILAVGLLGFLLDRVILFAGRYSVRWAQVH